MPTHTTVVALALLLGPIFVGAGGVTLARAGFYQRSTPPGGMSATAAAWVGILAMTLCAAVGSLFMPALNPADALCSGVVALLAAWVVGQDDGRTRAAAMGSVLLFGLVGEAVARLGAAPQTWEPSPVAIDLGAMAPRCTLNSARHAGPIPADGAFVLHLGDSIIGWARDGDFTAVEQLDVRDSRHVHVDAGIAGTGPDCALLLLRRVQGGTVVVLHLFAANDVHDLEEGYAWCDGQPLLDYSVDPPAERCPEVVTSLSLRGRVVAMPPPWIARWARPHLALAVVFTDAWERARGALTPSLPLDGRDEARVDAVLRAIRDEVADRGATLVVSFVPIRVDLPDEVFADRLSLLRRVAARLQLPTIDATDLFREAVAGGTPVTALHTHTAPFDPHFSQLGHHLYAEWLASALGPWLGPVATPSPAARSSTAQ